MWAKQAKVLEWTGEFSTHADFEALSKKFYENEFELVRNVYRSQFLRNSANSFLETYRPTIPCDEKDAEELLDKGKKYLDDLVNLQLATALFTRAIYKAPTDSAVLSIAHANRANVLMKLSEFEAAYDDCISALQFNHPQPVEVVQLQATISCKLQDTQKFKDCMKHLEEMNIDTTPFLNEFAIACQSDPLPKTALQERDKKTRIVWSSSGFDRRIVADEDIGINEHVISAEADVVDVGDEYRQRFLKGKETDIVMCVCDYCTEQDIIPFPCYECRRVFYCSRKCCQDDFYVHRYQCNGYKERFLGDGFPFRFAMRCLLAGFDHVLSELRSSREKIISQSAEDLWPIVLKTFHDGHIFGLFRNFEHFQEKHKIGLEGVHAMLSCQYLAIKTDFFKQTEMERSAYLQSELEWQIIAATIILRCRCQIQLTCFNINGFLPLKPFTTQSIFETELGLFKSVHWSSAGAAMNGRLGLINHSCEASCDIKFDKHKLTFISRMPIAKGDEITFDYLGNSACKNMDERRKFFQDKMGFLCKCERCKDDLLFIKSNEILCECGVKVVRNVNTILCPQCGQNLKAAICLQVLSNGDKFPDCDEKYNIFQEMHETLRKLVPKTSCSLWESASKEILSKYLSSSKCISNANVNEIMIGIASYFLELSETSYTRSLLRVLFAQILLDLIAIRKNKGYSLSIPYYSKDKIKQTFWILGKKEKRWFEMFCEKYIE